MVEIAIYDIEVDETFVDSVNVDTFLKMLNQHQSGVINILRAKIDNKKLSIEELLKVLKT